MTTRIFATGLFLFAILPFLSAQKSAILAQYIAEGLRNNLGLHQQQLDIRQQQESIRQAKAQALPNAAFNANYTRALGGRTIEFPLGDLFNPIYNKFDAIDQKPPGQPSPYPRFENQKIQFLPDNFHETKIKFAYPLYNTDLRYNRQIQEQTLLVKTAQKAATEHELRFQITEAYYQYLMALEAEKIWLNTHNVLSELRRFNESLVKNNVATKDVVASAEYELSKADNEINKLNSTQNTARAYFNYLLNKDLQAEVSVDSTLLRSLTDNYEPNTLVQRALEKRQEITALQAGVQAAETNVRRNDANVRLPDLYVGGEAGWQGFGYTFSGEQAYILAQIGLTYDLFDGGMRKSKAQEARIQVEKTRTQAEQVKQQIAMQVTAAWNDYDAARKGFETAQSGLKSAEAIFKIVNNKYRAGQVLLLEFLDAQNRVTTARLQQLLAWSEVLSKEAALQKAIGF